jgi:hypothetical protein
LLMLDIKVVFFFNLCGEQTTTIMTNYSIHVSFFENDKFPGCTLQRNVLPALVILSRTRQFLICTRATSYNKLYLYIANCTGSV